MPYRRYRIYRPTNVDEEHVQNSRRVLNEGLEALRTGPTDAFLGRKTQEPFPQESGTPVTAQQNQLGRV